MKRVEAELYQASMNPQYGVSSPITVTASDGEDYIVKSQQVRNTQGGWINEDAVFFQEALCYGLAELLNLPVPEFAIVSLDKEFITENDKDLLYNRHMQAGLYFGTKKMKATETNLIENYDKAIKARSPYIKRNWNDYFKKVVNKSDYANLIAFDIFTMNSDRYTNWSNILIHNTPNGRLMKAIDFGHCFFSPFYNSSSLTSLISINNPQEYQFTIFQSFLTFSQKHGMLATGLGQIFKAIEPTIHFDNNPFTIVDSICSLQPSDISGILAEIPSEWKVNGPIQEKEYLDFLLLQQQNIKYILQLFCDQLSFSNYIGGTLTWQENNATGTL